MVWPFPLVQAFIDSEARDDVAEESDGKLSSFSKMGLGGLVSIVLVVVVVVVGGGSCLGLDDVPLGLAFGIDEEFVGEAESGV
jgi:hypothetical protein